MADEQKILPTISHSGLEALARVVLEPTAQTRLNELSHLNSLGRLSGDEVQELDNLLEQVDELNLLKARAAYTLQEQRKADGS